MKINLPFTALAGYKVSITNIALPMIHTEALLWPKMGHAFVWALTPLVQSNKPQIYFRVERVEPTRLLIHSTVTLANTGKERSQACGNE